MMYHKKLQQNKTEKGTPMTYAYNSKIYLAEATLNVKDLARQTAFYTQILGLEMLSQTEEEVLLEAGGKPLVRLIQTDRTEALKASYGLYHMAILLPSREDLADVFKHMAELDYPFVGAADMAIVRPSISRIQRAMASRSTRISQWRTGISVRTVASLG